MTKELLQQAHDALITSLAYVDATSAIAEVQGALKAIEQALAQQEQPAQEAVAYELEAVKFANGKKLVYQKPENLASYIKVRTLVYADADPAPTQPAQEPVVVLPDGSAFGVMSLPLPADHWLYREREYATPKSEETVDLPPPFVPRTVENLELIRLAAKWAIRAATNCGKINDFDPDALVQNFVYATLGPYPQKIKDVPPTQPAFTQEPPAKTGARIQAIVTSCLGCTHRRYNSGGIYYCEKLGSDLDPRETFHPLCPLQSLSPTQPAQEPVAWYLSEDSNILGVEWSRQKPKYGRDWTPLYKTAPTQPALSDAEILNCFSASKAEGMASYMLAVVRAIEAHCRGGNHEASM